MSAPQPLSLFPEAVEHLSPVLVWRRISFDIAGVAEPQGSTRAFIPKGWSRAIITSDNPDLKQWRQLVAVAAGQAMTGEPMKGAVRLIAVFTLPRPVSVTVKKRPHHTVKPDTSKLVRALEDALTGVVWVDDCQVVDLIVRKRYADGVAVGATVTVEELG